MSSETSSHLNRHLLPLALFLLTLAMILIPNQSVLAARRGIDLWWDAVLPALLPFFILSELLYQFGVAHFLGVILEPIMRPIFNLPGKAGFVVAMGYSSGYPMGAILTSRLRSEGALTCDEASRLNAFSNNSSVLFIGGAVAVGLFHRVEWAFPLIISVYTASLVTGIMLGIPNRSRSTVRSRPPFRSIIGRARMAMLEAQASTDRPVGARMGEACRSAIQSLLGICGFIVLFSVILQMLGLLGVLGTLAHCIKPLLQWLGWDPRWSGVLVVGTVDLTISMQLASHLKAATNQVFGITAAVIAWSGICIHAQVAAAIAHTDVRLSTYYGAKALQALLAGALIQWFGIQQATPLIPVWATRAFTGNNPGWTSLWQLVMIVLSLLLFLRPRESRIPPKVIQR